MNTKISVAILAVAITACWGSAAHAIGPGKPHQWPQRRAQDYRWHAHYAHVQYGQPVAMVVPPTANLQTNWGWGAGSSRVSRIDHQFGRNWPGPGPHGGQFRPQPVWPADTAMYGVYNVRAPW